jgi:hypothetical protein
MLDTLRHLLVADVATAIAGESTQFAGDRRRAVVSKDDSIFVRLAMAAKRWS